MFPRTIVATLGFVIGLGALLLQFALAIPLRLSTGDNLLGAVVYYFTFFTILTNLMLVLIYLSELSTAGWLNWWRSPVTRAMMAGAMALLMPFYHLLLAGLWQPQGLQAIADTTLHYIAPTLYLLWWLILQPKGTLRFADIGWMVLPPAIWLVWTMLRGAVLNEYPYPILEVHKLGYPAVAANILVVLAILLGLFALTVVLDRLLVRRKAG